MVTKVARVITGCTARAGWEVTCMAALGSNACGQAGCALVAYADPSTQWAPSSVSGGSCQEQTGVAHRTHYSPMFSCSVVGRAPPTCLTTVLSRNCGAHAHTPNHGTMKFGITCSPERVKFRATQPAAGSAAVAGQQTRSEQKEDHHSISHAQVAIFN